MDIKKRKTEPQKYAGKEIFEIHPVILGGNPVDPNNKILLNREEHIKVVLYWNKLIRKLRQKQTRNE